MIVVEIGGGGFGVKFVVGLVVLLVCDSVWLKLANGACCMVYPLNQQSREEAEHTRQRTVPAVLVAGMVAALVTPIFRADTPGEGGAVGALLGFLVFGVFNAVEWALWSKWTLRTCVIDTCYGMAVYAFVLALQTVSVR